MIDAADRDGDGKLTPAELRAFLDLVELGVGCQVVIVVEDRGRNLFDLLDTNQDGVLDLAELNRAVRVCEEAALLPLTQATIPRQFQFSTLRGPVGSTFGPVLLPTPTKSKASLIAGPARGPKWFQAMDQRGWIRLAYGVHRPIGTVSQTGHQWRRADQRGRSGSSEAIDVPLPFLSLLRIVGNQLRIFPCLGDFYSDVCPNSRQIKVFLPAHKWHN
jgi:hypothetical protein